jgi:hypothetical protein
MHYQANLPDVCWSAVMRVLDHRIEEIGDQLAGVSS